MFINSFIGAYLRSYKSYSIFINIKTRLYGPIRRFYNLSLNSLANNEY